MSNILSNINQPMLRGNMAEENMRWKNWCIQKKHKHLHNSPACKSLTKQLQR